MWSSFVRSTVAIIGVATWLPAQQVVSTAASTQQRGATSVTAPGLAMPITLTVQNASLEEVLIGLTSQGGLRAVLSRDVRSVTTRISLRLERQPLHTALDQVLNGTGITYRLVGNDGIAFAKVGGKATLRKVGTVSGRVTDVKSKQPLRGVTVAVEGTTLTAITGDDGRFQIGNVPDGARVLSIRMLGYGKQARPIAVSDGQTISVDVTLEASASVLDQMVVTGTIVQTELKAVPSAITVITAKQIEERGITRIEQLFRGDIPGLFAQNQGATTSGGFLDRVAMYSRGATALSSSSAGIDINTQNSNVIKTYVDGVELADPYYLSQIDPKSIERIEILSGPQASTIIEAARRWAVPS